MCHTVVCQRFKLILDKSSALSVFNVSILSQFPCTQFPTDDHLKVSLSESRNSSDPVKNGKHSVALRVDFA